MSHLKFTKVDGGSKMASLLSSSLFPFPHPYTKAYQKWNPNLFWLNEAMVYVSPSRGLDSHPRLRVQSVPLGLFCPQFMHMTVLGSGRTGEGGWRLLSRLVLWFLRICGWLVTDLVLRWRSWGLVAHPTLSGHWEGLSYMCSLHTVHLTRSQSALWPGFLRSALWGAWVPRIQA